MASQSQHVRGMLQRKLSRYQMSDTGKFLYSENSGQMSVCIVEGEGQATLALKYISCMLQYFIIHWIVKSY